MNDHRKTAEQLGHASVEETTAVYGIGAPPADQSALERIREVVRRLAAHAVGFQDVLDDSDRGPWGKTIGADIAELRRMADETQPAQPARRVLTPNEHDRAWHAIEGAAGEPGADPGTILNAVLHALRIEAPTAEDEQAKCGKCQQPFDPTDTRFDGHARHRETPYCRRCVDLCHDSEIADHRCVICA